MASVEDLLSHALKTASRLGASYSEARFENGVSEIFVLRNGVVDVSARAVSRGIGVRVLYNKALGFSSTSDLTRKGVSDAVKKAVELAKASTRLVSKGVSMSEEKMEKARVAVKPRVRHENVSTEDKTELLKLGDAAIVEAAERRGVKAVARMLELSLGRLEKHVINTDGADVYLDKPLSALICIFTLFGEGRYLQRYISLGESRGWEAVERWRLDETMKEEASAVSEAVRGAVEPPKGKMDVILGSEIIGLVCHESAGHPGEADRMLGREAAQAGETYITREHLGSRIGSEHVTIVDNPALPNSFGYYLYDDEGVKVSERVLIERGVIKELLHNRETAPEFGVKSNAASRASSYNREPIVRMANTYMKPGDHSLEELIEDVKEGVYVKSYMEWNIDDKRWNQRYVGVEAYLIKDGELGPMVYQPVIELTTQGLYSAIDALGRDLKFYAGYCGKGDPMQAIPVWFGGPSARLRNIRLGHVAAQ
ncbi:MAG: TldD/PmbA family protein [Nitrososphaerota archaeon]|nr:TldD/PmbA family protein [Candidatus Calditenuaceae archaeon]MDW8073778.1 TldD/PmbA family protein [Nitrososphaerota archaeon]